MKIPTYDGITQTPDGAVSAPEPRDNTGQALSQLGEVGQKVFTNWQAQNDHAAARQAQTTYLKQSGEIIDGYMQLQGEDAFRAHDETLAKLQALQATAGSNLKGNARTLYDEATQGQNIEEGRLINRRAGEQSLKWHADVSTAAQKAGLLDFYRYGADSPLGQAGLARAMNETANLAGLAGFHPDDQYTKDALKQTASAAWTGLAKARADAGDYTGALKVLDEHKDDVDPFVSAAIRKVGQDTADENLNTHAALDVAAGRYDTPEVKARYGNISVNPVTSEVQGAGTTAPASPGDPAATPSAPAPEPKGAIYDRIGKVATAAGATTSEVGYAKRLVLRESGGRAGAKNGSSTGLAQFHPDTFYSVLPNGDINNPDDQVKATILLARRDRKALADARLPTDDATVYVMHQQGAGGGMALLTAPPEVGAVAALEPVYGNRGTALVAVAGNIGMPYKTPEQKAAANAVAAKMTAGQFVGHIRGYFNGGKDGAATADQGGGASPVPTGLRIKGPDGKLTMEGIDFLAQKAAESGPPDKFADTYSKTRSALMQQRQGQDAAENDVQTKAWNDVQPVIQANPDFTDVSIFKGHGWESLSETHKTALVMAGKQNADAQAKAAAAQKVVADKLALNQGIDPKDEKETALLDADYMSKVKTFGEPGSPQFYQSSVAYSAQLGAVPKSFQGRIRSDLRSGDPGRIAAATSAIVQMRTTKPALLDDFSQEDLRIANLAATYAGAGEALPDAVRRATEDQKINPEAKAASDQTYEKLNKPNPGTDLNAQWINKSLADPKYFGRGGEFFGLGKTTVATNAQFRSEFDMIAKDEFFRNGGDMNAARVTALDVVTRSWGRSDLSGKPVIMKWAPERWFGVYGDLRDSKWMGEQLRHDIPEGGAWPGGKFPDKLWVQVNPDTPFDGNGRPVYNVFYADPQGAQHRVLGKDGKPLSWQPRWLDSPEAKRQGDSAKDAFTGSHDEWLRRQGGAQGVLQPGGFVGGPG